MLGELHGISFGDALKSLSSSSSHCVSSTVTIEASSPKKTSMTAEFGQPLVLYGCPLRAANPMYLCTPQTESHDLSGQYFETSITVF